MDKEELRTGIRAKRLAMTLEEVETASEGIISRLLAEIDWQAVTSLHSFVPMPRLREVNTWPLLKYAWQNHPSITTAIPVADKRGRYESVKVSAATRWRGLLPDARLSTPAGFKFDVVIIPTLAFDSKLNRLGWGGGFYDRFLAGQPQALKIGLAYQSGFVKYGLPAEPHDIVLDKIITEQYIMAKS